MRDSGGVPLVGDSGGGVLWRASGGRPLVGRLVWETSGGGLWSEALVVSIWEVSSCGLW